MKTQFIESEPSAQPFFRESLSGLDVSFFSELSEADAQTDIACVYTPHVAFNRVEAVERDTRGQPLSSR